MNRLNSNEWNRNESEIETPAPGNRLFANSNFPNERPCKRTRCRGFSKNCNSLRGAHTRSRSTTATKKYCSSNANFIELFSVYWLSIIVSIQTIRLIFSQSVLCILFRCVHVCVCVLVLLTGRFFQHFLVAIIACRAIECSCLFVFGSFQRRLSYVRETESPKYLFQSIYHSALLLNGNSLFSHIY